LPLLLPTGLLGRRLTGRWRSGRRWCCLAACRCLTLDGRLSLLLGLT
jgi:hypothetical protein